MRLTVVFSRLCLVWLIVSQAMLTLGLWVDESDVDTLFGSEALAKIWYDLMTATAILCIALLLAGVFVVLFYAIRERALGLDTAWGLSGLVYMVLVVMSCVISDSLPGDINSVELGWAVWLGIIISLDVFVGLRVRRMLRLRCQLLPDRP